MNPTKFSFIELALQSQALQFGQFTLKSGRVSPYFFNAGLFYQGKALQALGQLYAKTLLDNNVACDHLFGPAYKGVPLATSTAIALAALGKECTVTFNRKETKDHAEGGQLIGAPLHGKTLIVDDVITAGTAFREAARFIQANGGHLTGIIIALDRCERGLGKQSTLTEIQDQGIAVYSIITLFDVILYLNQLHQYEKANQLQAYLRLYGMET